MDELVPLAPRARFLFHLQAFARLVLFWVPASVVTGVLLATTFPAVYALIAASALLFVVFVASLWYPSLAFDRWGYLLRDEDLLISNGVVFRRLTSIPTNRIQHVDTRQGPLEQWLGLTRLQIHTASGMGADGTIPGLDVDEAERLREALVARAEGDDGV